VKSERKESERGSHDRYATGHGSSTHSRWRFTGSRDSPVCGLAVRVHTWADIYLKCSAGILRGVQLHRSDQDPRPTSVKIETALRGSLLPPVTVPARAAGFSRRERAD